MFNWHLDHAIVLECFKDSWRTVSTYFRVKNPVGCTKSRFPEDLRMGKLGGEASVLRCVYLFVCVFAFCLL